MCQLFRYLAQWHGKYSYSSVMKKKMEWRASSTNVNTRIVCIGIFMTYYSLDCK